MRWREFFYMRKADRQVISVLLCVIVVALIVIWLTNKPLPTAGRQNTDGDSAAADSHEKTAKDHEPPTAYYRQPERQVELFSFDPNTADSTQLLRLGLQPWQVRNIYKYRAAGGIYRTKEDFAQLYGLTAKQYRALEPYITISPDYQPASSLFKKHSDSSRHGDTLRYDSPKKISPGEYVDLNIMDTTAYRTVPGIGSYYARKILDYGQRLGGYTSVDQLDEIDDFPSAAKNFFLVAKADSLQKLRINLLTLSELKRHPYLNYYQAKAIVDYRRQNGPIRNIDQLGLLSDFPQEAIERLRPYISYDE